MFLLPALRRSDCVLHVEQARKGVQLLCKTAVLNGWPSSWKPTLGHAALSNHINQQTIYVPEGREDNSAMTRGGTNAHVTEAVRGENSF